MLKIGDKVKLQEYIVVSWPKWAKELYLSRVGEVIENEGSLGYLKVRWDKPRWDDPAHFVDTEWSGWLEVIN
jgi:hypothetical protein